MPPAIHQCATTHIRVEGESLTIHQDDQAITLPFDRIEAFALLLLRAFHESSPSVG